jgi:hypothetical protein
MRILGAWMKGLKRYIERRNVVRTLVFRPKVIETGSIFITCFP